MKIFLTGASGFIGSNLRKFYQEHDIHSFKRTEDISAQLKHFVPDVIINCGAEIYNADDMWISNVELVKSCLDYIKGHTYSALIQIGSSSEYGNKYSRATTETDAIDPVNMYAGTKGIATILCQTYANMYGSDVTILRPYSPYGPGEQPHRLFPNLWRSFKLNRAMQLVNGVHDFCYIDDFVAAVDLVLQSKQRIPGEILNVSSGIEYTNLQVLEIFRKLTGQSGNVELIDKFVTPPVWKCNYDRINVRYGWSPKFTLEQGIQKFLETAYYE